jgi:hypothetical protein
MLKSFVQVIQVVSFAVMCIMVQILWPSKLIQNKTIGMVVVEV